MKKVTFPHVVFALMAGVFLSLTERVSASVLSGDYEARLGDILVQINITSGKSFSGRVIANGVPQSVVGTLNSNSENPTSFTAELPSLRNVAPLKLVYSNDGINESLVVSSMANLENQVSALLAVKTPPEQSLKGSHVLAFRVDNESNGEDVIAAKVSGLTAQIALKKMELSDVVELSSAAKTSLQNAQAESRNQAIAFKAAKAESQSYYAQFDTAKLKADAARAAFATVLLKAQTGIKAAFLQDTKVVSGGADAESLTQDFVGGVRGWLDQNAASLNPLASSFPKDVETGAAVFKSWIGDLSGGKYNTAPLHTGTNDAPWSDAAYSFIENVLNVPFVKRLPSNYTAVKGKALFSALAPHLLALVDAYKADIVAAHALAVLDPAIWQATHPDSDPSAITTAIQSLSDANAALVSALDGFKRAEYERLILSASIADFTAQKSAQTANLELRKFEGYAATKIEVSGGGKASKAMALFAGVTPDGQKWTYAASIRARDAVPGCVVLFQTLAGQSPVLGRVSLNGISSNSTDVVFAKDESDNLSWNGMSCVVAGPSAVIKAAPAMNVFQQTGDTATVLEFGDRRSDGLLNGFGAVVTKQNVVSKLRVARNGSVFTLAASPTADFTGKFSYTDGGPLSGFDGVLVKTAEGAVAGFGSLRLTKTSSVPMTVKVLQTGVEKQAPVLPVISPALTWKDLKASVLKFQLDVPAETALTTATLFKGKQVVATAVADATGLVTFKVGSASTGSDYRVEVVREYVTGAQAPVSSQSFVINQMIPAGSFQCLLAYASSADTIKGGTLSSGSYQFTESPDGNPFRARLSIVNTATGSWSGKVEYIDLRTVLDESGNAAPNWTANRESYPASGSFETRMPVLVTYPIVGTWTSSPTTENPERMISSVSVPTSKGGPAHTLTFSLETQPLAQALDFAATPQALNPVLSASMKVAGTEVELVGSCVPATKGVAGAKGRYTTFGNGLAAQKLGSSYTVDYSGGGSTVNYIWKTGATASTGAANVGVDGTIAFMVPPNVITKDKLQYVYTDASNVQKSAVSNIESMLYGFVRMELAHVEDSGSEKAVYGLRSDSLAYFTGVALEADPKMRGFYRYNTAWKTLAGNYQGATPGGFGYSETLCTTLRAVDLAAEEKVVVGQNYRFEVLAKGENAQEYTVQFSATGKLVAPADMATKTVLKELTVSGNTGLFTGSLQVTGVVKPVVLSGAYVEDDGTGMIARGVSAGGEVLWTLFAKP